MLSDHYPLCFSLKANCPSIPLPPSPILNLSVLIGQRYPTLILKSLMLWYLKGFLVYHLKFLTHCTIHQDFLDSYSQHLVFTLLTCSSQCFPTISSSSSRKLAGWTDSTTNLKRTANFWHKLWNDAGCPSSELKQNTKKYKREVRRLTRRHEEEQLWVKGVFFTSSPLGLLRAVFFLQWTQFCITWRRRTPPTEIISATLYIYNTSLLVTNAWTIFV